MAVIRTFVAVQASQKVNQNVARCIQRLANSQANYKWVATENLHVTLNFVGDVVDTEVPELCRLIKQEVEGFSAFEMTISGLGAFPNAAQPRTLWIGVELGAEQLRLIYKKIEKVLSHWGVNKDRNEYVPHMTLGRLKRGGRWNDALLEAADRCRRHDAGACNVGKVIVFSSYLDRSGPTHTPMATIHLKG